MKKMLFVFNPNSGKAQIKNMLLGILEIFSRADYEITIYPTKATKDGYYYIKENDGKYDIVVCSGGDGTLNETVAAIMEYQNSKPPIGYIPSGTTNDFARSLSIPKDMINAATHIVGGFPQKVDIGRFNGRYFNYVAAFGAFTEVSYATPQSTKNILGHQAYIIEGVKSITSIKPYHLKIELDDKVIEGDFIYGMITNSKSIGGFKNIAGKHVKLNDGLFEFTLFRHPKNPIDLQKIISSLVTQDYHNDMTIHECVSSIRMTSDAPIAWVLDGEYGGEHSEVFFEVEREAVDIIVNKKL